jgi:hypothetical protein
MVFPFPKGPPPPPGVVVSAFAFAAVVVGAALWSGVPYQVELQRRREQAKAKETEERGK